MSPNLLYILFLGKFGKDYFFHFVELLALEKPGEENNLSRSVNDDIPRYARSLQCIKSENIRAWIQRKRICNLHIIFKLSYCFQRFVHVNTDHHKPRVFFFLPDFALDKRHFLAAYAAPACSKLQHHHLASQIGKPVRLASRFIHNKVRRSIPYLHQVVMLVTLFLLSER